MIATQHALHVRWHRKRRLHPASPTLVQVVAAGYSVIQSQPWCSTNPQHHRRSPSNTQRSLPCRYLEDIHLTATWQQFYSADPSEGITDPILLQRVLGGEACMYAPALSLLLKYPRAFWRAFC